MTEDCLFCKIAVGELESTKIYEDEYCLAFLDTNPVAKGHTLLIPKKHSENILDTDPRVLGQLMQAAPKICKAVKEGVGADAFIFSANNGSASGQAIFHLHFHIIPRFLNDRLGSWPRGKYDGGEQEQTARVIKRRIV